MGNLWKELRARMRSRLLALATAIVFATMLVGQPAMADPGSPVDTTVVASANPTELAGPLPGEPATSPAAEVPTESSPTPTEIPSPPASDAPSSATPTDASPGPSSPGVPTDPATGAAPPAQVPSTPANNPTNGAALPVVPVVVAPAPEQALQTVAPAYQLPLDFATENALPDIAVSSDAAVAVPSPKATPSKSAGLAVKSKKNNTDALVAFQVNPNVGTATQLVAATGSSGLVQGLTILVLLILGLFYFRAMRRGGKRANAATEKREA